jgi:polyvinyl alcohol dehydrogenase (cytochrome)
LLYGGAQSAAWISHRVTDKTTNQKHTNTTRHRRSYWGPYWGPLLLTLAVLAGCEQAAEAPTAGAPAADALAADSAHSNAVLDPQAIYDSRCARCHSQAFPRAPNLVTFQVIGRDAIYAAVSEGLMREHVQGLDDSNLQALADHLGGSSQPSVPALACATDVQMGSAAAQPLQGFGLTLESTRFIPADIAGLDKAQTRNLALKWAFAYPGATRARSQPSYYAGAVLVGSQDGSVYALDLETGCAQWTFKADAEVRNSVSVATHTEQPRAMFGDIRGNVYAIDPATGELIWKTLANDHPNTTITGSPRLHKDHLYVPLSSTEWASAADPTYSCCTFRGGVAAIDIHSGNISWTSYSIPEAPKPGKLNSAGAQTFHPAGAPVWNSPTIDEQRGVLYVGTGEAYTSPAADTSDSILAMDLETGELLWSYQATAGDAWNMACFIGGGPNCPEEDGPDLDFGASPVLTTLPNGRDVILAGQKSGSVHALDPNNAGKLLWHNKVGRGGFAGGVHWGMASDGERLFVPIADTTFSGRFPGPPKPGLSALDPASGEAMWFTPAPDVCGETDRAECDPGLSAAITAIPGVVFSGAFDGHLRAYDSDNGEIIWDYNTNQSFDTVSGEVAHGGSIDADGPVVIDGHVLVNSGYLFGGRMGGNVLLVFAAK